MALVLTADEVAEALGYSTRAGDPDRDKVRRLARAGRIPQPIDQALPVVDWRWSRPLIERYAVGKYTPAAITQPVRRAS